MHIRQVYPNPSQGEVTAEVVSGKEQPQPEWCAGRKLPSLFPDRNLSANTKTGGDKIVRMKLLKDYKFAGPCLASGS